MPSKWYLWWAEANRGIARMDSTPPQTPNVIFGPLAHKEWRSLQSRYDEPLLSFLHPK